MRTGLKVASGLLASLVIGGCFGSAAAAKSLTVDGAVRLGISKNEPPVGCWVESDCPEGEICHMSINITGEPAQQLLDTLKAKVPMDEQFKEWGLSIYISKDGNLMCDGTEDGSPGCTINFNPSEAKLEGPLSCE